MKIDNTVIQVLNPEHGQRVVEWFSKQGVNTSFNRGFNIIQECYGVVDGKFDNHKGKLPFYVKIIELPTEEKQIIESVANVVKVISEALNSDYDFINPNHYKKFSVETIDMMVAIWGKEATALHCEMCAFKYRLRMGEKPDQPVERDLEKVNWYLNKANELRNETA